MWPQPLSGTAPSLRDDKEDHEVEQETSPAAETQAGVTDRESEYT